MGYRKMIRYGTVLELYEYEKNLSSSIGRGKQALHKRNALPSLASNRADTLQRKFEKRQDNARRARMVFLRLVSANIGGALPPLLVTLTYKENMQDLRRGYKDFHLFGKALRNKFGKQFSYICVPEFQKRGAVHFHCLFWGLPLKVFANQRTTRLVDGIWGKGFVFMKMTDGNEKLSSYLGKYMSKTYTDKRLAGMKAFTASRNIKRPLCQPIPSAYDVEADYELSTAITCKISEYRTLWLGTCRKRIYQLASN